jgi:hypothetical protein
MVLVLDLQAENIVVVIWAVGANEKLVDLDLGIQSDFLGY